MKKRREKKIPRQNCHQYHDHTPAPASHSRFSNCQPVSGPIDMPVVADVPFMSHVVGMSRPPPAAEVLAATVMPPPGKEG